MKGFESIAAHWKAFRYDVATITLAGVVFSLPFFLVSLGFIFFWGEHTTLRCQRLEPTLVNCQLIFWKLAGTQSIALEKNALQGATVQVKYDQENGDAYRVVLHTQTGTVPMTSAALGGGGEYKATEAITAFLNDRTQTSLIVEQDNRWLMYTIAGFFFYCGGWFVLKGGH
jgi:hypothetical protein